MQNLDVLIVGAGVAGLTCAALLEKHGLKPTIIERDAPDKFNTSGYMLGLLPLGGRVLNELDLQKEYFEQSIQMEQYEIHKEDGSLNKAYSLSFINEDYGSYRGIGRKELIEILLTKTMRSEIKYGITSTSFNQTNDGVEVKFSDGSNQHFDLVIAADGVHSQTRKQLWDKTEYNYFDTHWGGWVAWVDSHDSDVYKEYWGASSFMGVYPIKGKTGVFLGAPTKLTEEIGLKGLVEKEKQDLLPKYEFLHKALDALSNMENPFYWEFHDCKTETWTKGRVVLLGDAASGFLPTAGVGASMAMDSASALVDELSRTEKEHVEYGLKLYVKRQKQRVEKAQKDSRDLAKLMFIKSGVMSHIRDYAIRFYSIKQLAKNITKTIEGV